MHTHKDHNEKKQNQSNRLEGTKDEKKRSECTQKEQAWETEGSVGAKWRS
jgi:hypothetical protein